METFTSAQQLTFLLVGMVSLLVLFSLLMGPADADTEEDPDPDSPEEEDVATVSVAMPVLFRYRAKLGLLNMSPLMSYASAVGYTPHEAAREILDQLDAYIPGHQATLDDIVEQLELVGEVAYVTPAGAQPHQQRQ